MTQTDDKAVDVRPETVLDLFDGTCWEGSDEVTPELQHLISHLRTNDAAFIHEPAVAT